MPDNSETPDVVEQNLYDFPKYYELVFGSDWAPELHFLEACFAEYGKASVQRLFEPACGTGRLLYRFGQRNYEVAGLDLNSKAVDYCNARLQKHGLPAAAVVADMSDFTLKTLNARKKFDAAFNTINSFRHLASEAMALAHLQCVGAVVKTGGLYVLGLHLTPTVGPRTEDEAWSASRGPLTVNSYLWSKGVDLKKREEYVGMTFDIYTPTKQFQIRDETVFRTYTAPQMQKLITNAGMWKVRAAYDFTYDFSRPLTIGPETEDVVYILQKTS